MRRRLARASHARQVAVLFELQAVERSSLQRKDSVFELFTL